MRIGLRVRYRPAHVARNVQRRKQRSPGDDYAEAAWLREGLRRFRRRTEDVTRLHKLTPQRYELLLMIKTPRDGSGRVTLAELVDRLQLAPNTVTELVHRCEDAGLVQREVDSGRRGVLYLRATREGEHRLARAWAELRTDRERLAAVARSLEPGTGHGAHAADQPL
jgi:DNA-binding MarR family transcriptional regulator